MTLSVLITLINLTPTLGLICDAISLVNILRQIINKRGNAIARKLLFFAVGNMLRCQHRHPNHIVDYYYRLKEKRPYPKTNKVAKVACMNKTLKCLLSMIKYHQKYCYQYTDSQSL